MEKIEELFKKFVYTGVGLVSLTKERLEKTIKEMVDENKMTTKEGEKIVNDFFKNTESKKKELEEDLKKVVEKAIDKFKFATSNDLEKLKKKVSELEDLLKGK